MWLLGWRLEDMAETLEEAVRTVRRRLAGYDLMGEEAPGERARLVLAVMTDRLGDGLVSGEDVREAALSLQRTAGAVRVTQAVETEGEDDAGTEEDDGDYEEDEIDRLVAMDLALAGKALGHSEDARPGRADRVETKSHQSAPVPSGAARYTGAAAGPGADVAAFGLTWRGEDAGGGRVGALGGFAGGVSPGGAGGAFRYAGRPDVPVRDGGERGPA